MSELKGVGGFKRRAKDLAYVTAANSTPCLLHTSVLHCSCWCPIQFLVPPYQKCPVLPPLLVSPTACPHCQLTCPGRQWSHYQPERTAPVTALPVILNSLAASASMMMTCDTCQDPVTSASISRMYVSQAISPDWLRWPLADSSLWLFLRIYCANRIRVRPHCLDLFKINQNWARKWFI